MLKMYIVRMFKPSVLLIISFSVLIFSGCASNAPAPNPQKDEMIHIGKGFGSLRSMGIVGVDCEQDFVQNLNEDAESFVIKTSLTTEYRDHKYLVTAPAKYEGVGANVMTADFIAEYRNAMGYYDMVFSRNPLNYFQNEKFKIVDAGIQTQSSLNGELKTVVLDKNNKFITIDGATDKMRLDYDVVFQKYNLPVSMVLNRMTEGKTAEQLKFDFSYQDLEGRPVLRTVEIWGTGEDKDKLFIRIVSNSCTMNAK